MPAANAASIGRTLLVSGRNQHGRTQERPHHRRQHSSSHVVPPPVRYVPQQQERWSKPSCVVKKKVLGPADRELDLRGCRTDLADGFPEGRKRCPVPRTVLRPLVRKRPPIRSHGGRLSMCRSYAAARYSPAARSIAKRRSGSVVFWRATAVMACTTPKRVESFS